MDKLRERLRDTAYGLAFWDTIAAVPCPPDIDLVRGVGLEGFLPAWFDLETGNMDVRKFFWNLAADLERHYMHSTVAQRYHQDLGDQPDLREVRKRVIRDVDTGESPTLLALNFLFVREANRLTGDHRVAPETYLLANAGVMARVGFPVFDEMYQNDLKRVQRDHPELVEYCEMRNDWARRGVQSFITELPVWEQEADLREDGSLNHDREVILTPKYKFFHPEALKRGLLIYEGDLRI